MQIIIIITIITRQKNKFHSNFDIYSLCKFKLTRKEVLKLFITKCQVLIKSFGYLFFKFKFIYFNWRLITLQYCIGFAIHQHEFTKGVHVPHPEPPTHFPPHTIPLGHPSAPALRFLYPASNLDWRFVSYMILYMLNSILPNHPPPSHRVQKTVLYICVSFAVLHTGLSLPSL